MEALEEIDISLNPEEELLDLDKWEPELVKFITIKITRDYVDIVTNYWRA